MRQGLILASVFLTGGFRCCLYLLLTGRILEKKGLLEKPVFLSGAAATGGIAEVLCLLPVSEYGRMLLEALWLGGYGAYGLRTDRRMSLFLAALYELAYALWQFLFGAGLGFLLSTDSFVNPLELNAQAGAWLTLVLFGFLAVYGAKHPDMTEQENFRLVSLPVLGGFLGIITLSQEKPAFLSEDVIDVWVMLSLILLIGLLVFHMNRQYRMEQELARLKAEQAELLERDYQALNQSYGANARLFHDVHRHLETLHRLLIQKKYGKAVEYLDDLQGPVRELAETVYTGDEAVDYLLNSRVSMAAGEEISLDLQVEFPRRTNLRSGDLCAILGNLLDNALEAAGKVADPKERKVTLVIRRIHRMLVIKVENTFTEVRKGDDGELKTTKTDGGLHGWGLKSVRVAAEKYEGTLQTACEGNRFRAVVTLFYQGDFVKENRQ